MKLTACVISFNRAGILGTCLRALRFADEVLVIDKSSTDGARDVAARFADRVVTVPFSPTVEDTREFAVSLCRHDWVLLLDDDECLNAAAVDFIVDELRAPSSRAYAFPLRHYVLGRHDERAYYWPEHHLRLFHRDAVRFGPTVHAGMTADEATVFVVPADHGACIHHLSHPDVAGWIERTNRYTSRPDRASVPDDGLNLTEFAHARIDHWFARSSGSNGDDYLAAVSLLRAVYDIVDRLKIWEAEQGLDGANEFRDHCRRIDAEHDDPGRGRHGSGGARQGDPEGAEPAGSELGRRRTWREWPRLLAGALLAGPPGIPISLPAFRRPPG